MLQDKINFINQSKIFIDNVEGNFTKGLFTLGFFSGFFPYTYVFSAIHIKRIYQWLGYIINEYEKVHGKINGEDWKPSIKSPFDFGGGDDINRHIEI